MKKYTFELTGGSPYNGDITIIAENWTVAKRYAVQTIKYYNEETIHCQLELTGHARCDSFDPPCVVHFESGEA